MRIDRLRISVEDFRERVGAAPPLEEADPFDYGDHSLNRDMVEEIEASAMREAAVLVPVIDHPDEPTVLLTLRTSTLRKHSGQIAFPGGAVDPEDGSPEVAAIREAEEEIGLPPGHIETIGRLPVYMTLTGYRITPVLAVVRPGFHLTLNPQEVEDAFEVPLSFLMNPANHNRESRVWNGRTRHYFTMPFGEWHIWGITAGILRLLYERLYA